MKKILFCAVVLLLAVCFPVYVYGAEIIDSAEAQYGESYEDMPYETDESQYGEEDDVIYDAAYEAGESQYGEEADTVYDPASEADETQGDAVDGTGALADYPPYTDDIASDNAVNLVPLLILAIISIVLSLASLGFIAFLFITIKKGHEQINQLKDDMKENNDGLIAVNNQNEEKIIDILKQVSEFIVKKLDKIQNAQKPKVSEAERLKVAEEERRRSEEEKRKQEDEAERQRVEEEKRLRQQRIQGILDFINGIGSMGRENWQQQMETQFSNLQYVQFSKNRNIHICSPNPSNGNYLLMAIINTSDGYFVIPHKQDYLKPDSTHFYNVRESGIIKIFPEVSVNQNKEITLVKKGEIGN